jgi:plasmid stabilization system protein ParE
MKVIWSDEAKASYRQTIYDLLQKWPIEIAIRLEDAVNSLIHNLEYHNHICPSSKKDTSIRKCVVSKQSSIIYIIENNTIHLVGFFYNKTNHNF